MGEREFLHLLIISFVKIKMNSKTKITAVDGQYSLTSDNNV